MEPVPDNVAANVREAQLEHNPEVRAKRIAEMQTATPIVSRQTAGSREQQAEFARADKPVQGQTGPATRNLTIIWEDEKQAMLERIEALEIDVTDLKGKLQQLLEAYRTYAAKTP
jgi:hypothetical protein